jgi:3-hydroxyacyl-CoA dehydrogenase
MSRFQVKKVAVLGAGVMGAQIAAHLVNVKVPVVLFDLPAKEGPKNGIVTKAIDNLKKLKPAPLGVADDAVLIQQANYEEHMDVLGECDLIIEAIAERMDWKLDLYKKIAPFVAPHAIVASNTSGLSITKLSEALPEEIKPRFCGIHFFNPPRYMALVELINTPTTLPQVLDDLEAFVTSNLGKGVVHAKDSPNFIANRVGIAGMLATMKEVENFGLTYDVVDDLTGKKLGRASSGTFRTADVVGLDTMAHVIKTLQDTLSLETDPFYASFETPAVLKTLLEMGNLGQKTKAGFFKKVGRDVLRFDLGSKEYVPAAEKADEVYARMLKKPAAERLKLLRNSEGKQGQFLWAILRNAFHYAAVHLASIADNARDVDFCMRWGFGMQQGPFELWQEAGWLEVAKMVQEDIEAGKALCKAPLPEWVFKGPVADAGGVHTPAGSWNPTTGKFVAPRSLPVYARQHFPESVLGANAPSAATAGKTLHEDEAIRLWTLDDEVIIASIKTKMHAIGAGVMEGLDKAIDMAEKDYKGLVIWSPDEMFSAGADLQSMLPAFMMGGAKAIDGAAAELQRVMLKLRYCQCANRLRDPRPGLGWRLRAGRVLRQTRRGHGELHRFGRSRRGPGARCRWPDLHRPPCGGEHGAVHFQGRAALPDRRLHRRRHGQSGYQRAGKPQAGLPAGERRDRAAQGRAVVCRHQRGQGDVCQRLPCTAQAPIPGGRPQWHRHDHGAAGQYAGRWFHQRARFSHWQADCRGGVWWPVGCRHPGQRRIRHGHGAQGLLQPAGPSQDARADHGHDVHRQAGS